MTGKEWISYFESLKTTDLIKIRNALSTLASNRIFKREYGIDFIELRYFADTIINNKENNSND